MISENSRIKIDSGLLNSIVTQGLELSREGKPYNYRGMALWVFDETQQRYTDTNNSIKYLLFTDRPDYKTKFVNEILRRKRQNGQDWSGRVVCSMSANWPHYYFADGQNFGTQHCTVIDRALQAFVWAADKRNPEENARMSEKCDYLVGDVLNVEPAAQAGMLPGANGWRDLIYGDEIIDLTNIGDHVEEFDDRLDDYLEMILNIAMNVRPGMSLDFILTSKHGVEKLDEYYRLLRQKISEKGLPLNMGWLDNEALKIPNMKVPAESEVIGQFLVLSFTRK